MPPLSFGHFPRIAGANGPSVRPGHPLRSLRSASPSLRERDGRPLGSRLRAIGFPVGELIGEGEGLGLAAGVDEDYGVFGLKFRVRIWAIRADMDLPV